MMILILVLFLNILKCSLKNHRLELKTKIEMSEKIKEYIQTHDEKPKQLYICMTNYEYEIHTTAEGDACMVKAVFHNSLKQKGWDTLYFEILQHHPKSFYFMGYLEGILTYKQIQYFLKSYIGKENFNIDNFNMKDIDENGQLKQIIELIKKINQKLDKQINKIKGHHQKNEMIDQVVKLRKQKFGILHGYNFMSNEEQQITEEILDIINYDGAIHNLLQFLEGKNHIPTLGSFRLKKLTQAQKKFIAYLENAYRGRCTVLFKYLNDKVLMSHQTWDSYSAMQRIFKMVKTDETTITYSSYPGCISSTDDFFMINSQMIVTETSLDFNLSKDQKIELLSDKSTYIPEFYKVMASNYLSKTPIEWMTNMQKFQGGIYVSQWIVYDNELFLNRDEIKKQNNNADEMILPFQGDFLLMFEDDFFHSQVVSLDDELLTEGFFSSYNESFKKEEYHKDPRYITIKNNQQKVKDLKTLKQFMGHNEQVLPSNQEITEDFEHVEEQIENSVMYRFDLLNVDLAKGGIDIKITDSDMIQNNQCYARNGPAGAYSLTHIQEGLPVYFDFEFLLIDQTKLQSLRTL